MECVYPSLESILHLRFPLNGNKHVPGVKSEFKGLSLKNNPCISLGFGP